MAKKINKTFKLVELEARELEVGDVVVELYDGEHIQHLKKGIVVKFGKTLLHDHTYVIVHYFDWLYRIRDEKYYAHDGKKFMVLRQQ